MVSIDYRIQMYAVAAIPDSVAFHAPSVWAHFAICRTRRLPINGLNGHLQGEVENVSFPTLTNTIRRRGNDPIVILAPSTNV